MGQRVVEAAREAAGNGAFISLAVGRAPQLNGHGVQLRTGGRSRRKGRWIEIYAHQFGERLYGLGSAQSKRYEAMRNVDDRAEFARGRPQGVAPRGAVRPARNSVPARRADADEAEAARLNRSRVIDWRRAERPG